MKKILFAMVMLVSAFAPAHADPLPESYLGLWCFDKDNPYNTSGTSSKDTCSGIFTSMNVSDLIITRYGYQSNARGNKCGFIFIKHTGKKAATSTQARPENYIPIIHTMARCIEEGSDKSYIEKRELMYYKGSLTIKELK
jgi:hypothetical protein